MKSKKSKKATRRYRKISEFWNTAGRKHAEQIAAAKGPITSLRITPPEPAPTTRNERLETHIYENGEPQTFMEWLERYTVLVAATQECVEAMRKMAEHKAIDKEIADAA